MLQFYTDWDNQGINELCKSKLELGQVSTAQNSL